MLLGTFMVLLALLTFCTKSEKGDEVNQLNHWTYSGTVINAQTGGVFGLNEVVIAYVNEANVACTVSTNINGQFSVPNNPVGARAFTFSRAGFTTMRRTAESVPDSTGVTPDKAVEVTLYPLTGSVTGKVVGLRHSAAFPKYLAGVQIVAKYDTTGTQFDDMKGAFYLPVKATSAVGGVFTLTGLPVAKGAYLEISQVLDSGVTYEYKGMVNNTIPVQGITDGKIVTIGDLDMTPVNASAFKRVSDNLDGIKPSSTLSIGFTTVPDEKFSKYLLKKGSQQIPTTLTVDPVLKTINIKPSILLSSATTYTLTGKAYGLAGGEIDAVIDTIIVKNGGLEFVDSSNVFANGVTVDGIGKKEPIYFRFTKAIQTMSAVVNNGLTPVTVAAAGNLLTITPVQEWGTSIVLKVDGALAGGFFRKSDVNFILTITPGSSLKIIADNFKDGTLPFNGTLSVTANVPLQSANCNLNGTILTTATVAGQVASFKPAGNLVPGQQYLANIVLLAKDGQKLVVDTVRFTVSASTFFPVASNIWNNNNSIDPVQNFKIRENIVFTYSEAVAKVDVVLKDFAGNTVLVAPTANGVTVTIDPSVELLWNTNYILNVIAVNAANVKHVVLDTFKTEVNPFYVLSSNVRYDNMWDKPKEDFPSNAAIVISMSKPIKNATVKLAKHWGSVSGGNFGSKEVQTHETINESVLTIKPEKELSEDTTYFLIVHMEDMAGYIYSPESVGNPKDRYFVFGLSPDATSHVKSSNVLTGDLVPETQVDVNTEIWFELFNTPDNVTYPLQVDLEDSLAAGSFVYDKTVRINGDTIFIKPTKFFTYDQRVAVYIKGRYTDGTAFEIDYKNSNALWAYCFQTEREIFVTETNTDLADGAPVMEFTPYAPMTFVFSEMLDADLSKIRWNTWTSNTVDVNGGITSVNKAINGDKNTGTVNCTFALSADQKTLTVTPVVNLININQSDRVGFAILVKGTDYKTSKWINVAVRITPFVLQVATSNTKKTNGDYREDFGLTEAVNFTLNLDVTKIVRIETLAANPVVNSADYNDLDEIGIVAADFPITPVPDLTIDQVTLSRGKNVTFQTLVKFDEELTYAARFVFEYADGVEADVVVAWKTVKGVGIVYVNNRDGTYFRPFKVTGDSLVVKFTKEVDVTKNFEVVNFQPMNRLNVTWKDGNKTAVIRNLDTLNAAKFSTTGYQSGNASTMMYGSNTIVGNGDIYFKLTCVDGEVDNFVRNTSLEAIEVHTEQEIYLTNASCIQGVFTTDNRPYDDAANLPTINLDTIAEDASIVLTFNRPVHKELFDLAAVNLYRKYIQIKNQANASDFIEFTVTYSEGNKVLTLKPTTLLLKDNLYDIVITDVPGEGLRTNPTITNEDCFSAAHSNTAGLANTLLSNTMQLATNGPGADFRIVFPEFNLDISNMSVVLEKADKVLTTTMLDKRYGYSPGTYAGLTTHGNFLVNFTEPAWGAKHDDSLTNFQVRVRRVYKAGTTTNWNLSLRNAAPSYIAYNYDEFNNGGGVDPKHWRNTLDVTALATVDDFFDVQHLLTTDNDGSGSIFINGDHLYNDSSYVEVQMRPVYKYVKAAHVADVSLANKPWTDNNIQTVNTAIGDKIFYGKWSNTITFGDDVAPGDTTFDNLGVALAYPTAAANPLTYPKPNFDNYNFTRDTLGDLQITFNEDMDTSKAPVITFYNGLNDTYTSVAPSIVTLGTGWVTARKYQYRMNIPAYANYKFMTAFGERFEVTPTGWVLGSNRSDFTVDAFAGKGPSHTTGVLTGPGLLPGSTKILGTSLNNAGNYKHENSIIDMTAAGWDINGVDEDDGQYIVKSKSFRVPDPGTAPAIELKFWRWSQLEGVDRVEVEYDQLDNNVPTTTDNFEGTLGTFTAAHNMTDDGSVVAGQWKEETLTIPAALKGKDIKIRFRMRTQTVNLADIDGLKGFFVDNLRVIINRQSWYYNVSVVGMKDFSGVPLQSYGSKGNANNGIAFDQIASEVDGNANVDKAQPCN
jgi:hypothetical protein